MNAIECKGGAHTSHDGRDNGADDNQLLEEVNIALNGDDDQPQIARTGLAPIQGEDYTLGLQNEGEVSDASPSPAENPDTTNSVSVAICGDYGLSAADSCGCIAGGGLRK
ncbi:hypothetical protein PF007_g25032 [Phytophthora fragariae]|uniref:Uncharacterized protein n=1 Tax=Phytophthora fragariae TaxID=53985 RepID=A0A6A3QG90_9STRA|nr:hypothetical protein PF007_g25032 [Phytophthora fragariae]KAE9280356.1 hypothetical protein PF001_g24271 [Phytophthora fragariae]KAE9323438.1 hypothetical protein PF008_g17357 [Phytophthora fragariae]